MAIQRVALIFDDAARPETTGVYCRSALEKLVQVVHFRPGQVEEIPRQGFDLYLQIDDGLEYRHPAELRPAAWWAIDTHLNFDWCLKKAGDFDSVFAAQRDGAERLRQAGIASAQWLPLACDPAIHRKHRCKKRYNVCFVGNVFPGARAELIERIGRNVPDVFVGRCYFEGMAKTYSASRIVFNRSITNDVNMRVFEALACGSLLLTNDLSDNGQAELFQDGVHLATYRQPEELLDKIAYYLKNEEVRERIAKVGHKEAISRHTYKHRMQQLLAACSKPLGSASRSPPTPLPGSGAEGSQNSRAASPSPPAPLPRSGGEGSKTASTVPYYFEFVRPELLALVPESARKVLDIGCGAGRLGEAIKKRQPAEVVGIEREEQPAAAARERLDGVLTGDVELMEPDFEPGSFDAVVCGDVLEHLRDPGRLLSRIRGWLKPDGRLIASIPNVRHHTVVRSLLAGNWTYESAGLLDRDHLRFFTRREIEKLFHRAGFSIRKLQFVAGPGDDGWQWQADAGKIQIGPLHIAGLPSAEARDFYAYQYLLSAAPAPMPDYGLTSIIIVTHNELAYTTQCLDSIRQYTDPRYELIVVDNGSTDGTVPYSHALSQVKLITNTENRGFPAAANQGMRAASGRQILLLNNDTVVTTGWLDRQLRALHSDPRIGLVGPCSNYVASEQQVEAGYDHMAALDGFAWDWGHNHEGLVEETDRLIGFCLLIRRELIDAIGYLDERFGIGCFDDDDYCLRARQAGFRAVIARDAFIHHYGSRTFIGSGVDFAGLMHKNQKLFQEKWTDNGAASKPVKTSVNASSSGALPSSPYVVQAAASGGLLLVRRALLISCCMIVRDNEHTIEAAIRSIQPWVDEIVVVDTGSKDRTPQIVQRLGCRLYHFTWCDDFSAARNESLKHARGKWLFWMDSDDVIDEANGRALRGLVDGQVPDATLGFTTKVRCPCKKEDGSEDFIEVDQLKLFRNLPYLRFEGMIHEQIIPAINRAGGDKVMTDLFLVHANSDRSAEGLVRKLERDLRILHKELKQRPQHPFTLFNLGMTYLDGGDHAKAEEFLRRCIRHSTPSESHLRKAYAYLVECCQARGRDQEAGAVCEQGLALYPEDAELRFLQAGLLQRKGNLREAVEIYQGLLQANGDRYFSSRNRGLTGFLARQNLAGIYEEMRELGAAEEQWRQVVGEMPRYRPGLIGLGEVLIKQGKHQETLALVKDWQRDSSTRAVALILRGKLAEAVGKLDDARQAFLAAVEEYPRDHDAREALCRFLFEHGTAEEAERSLRQQLALEPENGAAHHNLGAALCRMGRAQHAAEAYGQSLRLRPDHVPTYLQLGHALAACGRRDEAGDAWRQILRIDPSNREAKQALASLTQLAAV